MSHSSANANQSAALWLISMVASVMIAIGISTLVPVKNTGGEALFVRTMVQTPMGPKYGHGSGIYLGNGFVLTAAHVARDEDQLWVKQGELLFPLELIWSDEDEDYALLRLTEHYTHSLFKADKVSCVPPELGQDLIIKGFPADLNQTVVRGYIAGKEQKLDHWAHAWPMIAGIFYGNSGGPVYNTRGEVIGISVGLLDTPVAVMSPIYVICPKLPRGT